MRISITCPTRGRLKSLDRFIKSAFDMAYEPDKVELLFAYDSDDYETRDFFLETWKPNIKVIEVPITEEDVREGLNIHQRYFNPLARISRGKYVWGTGNDVEFITPNYDKIIEEEVENFLIDKPDRLVYVVINHDELVSSVPWCAFPITTIESVMTIGGTMPKEITSWGADRWMWEIYSHLCEPRILNIADKIAVKHWSFHTGRKHGEEEVDKGRSIGDMVMNRLSTKVLNLNLNQAQNYVNQLNQRIISCKT